MDMMKEDHSIDVYGFCKKLNNERMGLVESVVRSFPNISSLQGSFITGAIRFHVRLSL